MNNVAWYIFVVCPRSAFHDNLYGFFPLAETSQSFTGFSDLFASICCGYRALLPREFSHSVLIFKKLHNRSNILLLPVCFSIKVTKKLDIFLRFLLSMKNSKHKISCHSKYHFLNVGWNVRYVLAGYLFLRLDFSHKWYFRMLCHFICIR